MTLFLWLQVVASNTQPAFFPNTLEGWLKIVLVYGVSTAATLAAVWRMMKKPLELSINGIGARVTKLEHAATANDSEHRKMNEELQTGTRERQYLREQLGEVKLIATEAREQLTDVKVDIIGHITMMKDAVLADVARVREDVQQVRERVVRVETTIDHRGRPSGPSR